MRKAATFFALSAALSLGAQQRAAFALPNGLKVRVYEDHSLPLLRGELRLTLPRPSEDGEAWMRPLGFRMLGAGGSGARGAAAFAQAADAIGLDLHLATTADSAAWTFSVRSQDQEAALALLADRVTRPGFDPIALETARNQAWNELSESDALIQAQLRFSRGLSAVPEPEEQLLGAGDPARLSAWHHRLFRPEQATLALWGDLDEAQARQVALLSLGAWTDAPAGPARPSGPSPESGPFLAALPGEAPTVAVGLVSDGTDAPARRFLRTWVDDQLKADGFSLATGNEGDALVATATAPVGTPAETLRARISSALDALPEALSAAGLSALQARDASLAKLMGLHPAALVAKAAREAPPALDLPAAKAVLSRWCAPPNRRLFASGDPGSLQGLQTTTPKR